MQRLRSIIQSLSSVIGLLLIGLILIFVIPWLKNHLISPGSPATGDRAYPLPTSTELVGYPAPVTPDVPMVVTAYPWHYPEPVENTSDEPVTPNSWEVKGPLPPPPGWPTDQPWPPDKSKVTPQPTPTLRPPFPTPALELSHEQDIARSLNRLWFPFDQPAYTRPAMAEMQLGRAPVTTQRSLALDVYRPGFGASLYELHLSPDHHWLVADYHYVSSKLIDLETGEPKDLSKIIKTTQWKFFAWLPGLPPKIAVAEGDYPHKEIFLVDLNSDTVEPVSLSFSDEYTWLRSLAYSPDGKYVASAAIYPAVENFRKTDSAVVRLGLSEETHPLAEIPGGVTFVSHSLRWSNDSRKLAWQVIFSAENGSTQTHLWVADLETGKTQAMGSIGEFQYSPLAWSPDGAKIAVLITEAVEESKVTANNIYLIDAQTGDKTQLTKFIGTKLSHLSWTPDGRWLLFTRSNEEYGEIWSVSADGLSQTPLAGPTWPDAPFVWFPR